MIKIETRPSRLSLALLGLRQIEPIINRLVKNIITLLILIISFDKNILRLCWLNFLHRQTLAEMDKNEV